MGIGGRILALAVIVAIGAPGATQDSPPALTDLLQGYWDGNSDLVGRRITGARDVDRLVPAIKNWIAAEASASWPMATSVLLLDLAAVALRPPEPSPATAMQLLEWGREQITSKEADRDPRANRGLEKLLHQAAIGLLQGIGAFKEQQQYLEEIRNRFAADFPPRLWLARGIALDQQAARSTGERTTAALEQATRFYDLAARDTETRAEASARAAFAFIRLGRHRDAIRRLDTAGETPDLAVAAWLRLLRSRALAALGEDADARLNAEIGAKISAGLGTSDPWTLLERGDDRLVAGWLPRLRDSLSATAAAGSSASRPASFDVLDQYDRGEYETAVTTLIKLRSLEAFSKVYQDAADRWIRDLGPAHVERRRNIVAVVALEAAHARGGVEWPHAQVLVEWACARLRATLVPTELERRWMHAASALLEGAVQGAALELHVTHALKRFPDDPALILARAVAAELRAGPDQRTASGTQPPEAGETSSAGLTLVASRLQQAARLPEIQREAQLRLGYTALRQGKAQVALDHLAAAASANAVADPYLDYLIFLFRGRALDRLKRWDDAAAAYRKAVELQPGVQSAELALATALFRAGHRAEASAAADRALSRREATPDPWLFYGQSDFRHWPALLDQLRRGVQ